MSATPISTLDGEYRALRDGCGLIDRSERGKLALSGPGAVEFLNGQVTNELATLHPGEGCYAAFLTYKGKMLGDLRILARGDEADPPDLSDPLCERSPGREHSPGAPEEPEELLLDTERVALQALFDMIRRFKVGYDVELHKRTVERGLLSLIGPGSGPIAAAEALSEAEHANAPVEIDGVGTLAVRTDVGVDLFCDAADSERLAAALLARGATPVSEQSVECLRIEHGRPRYGIDLDDTTIPQEAGLNERAVSFTKGCYVGQETVARLFYRGKPNRRLCGMRLSEAALPGAELHLGERVVGRLTSAAVSPTLGPIGLALVRREAEIGTTVAVGEDGTSAEVLELPFSD
ncbi:MAG TPA: glycine cleavage T C-terminal barrel domain-containing protein [Solirubrobacteraceae bacterium]